MASLSAAVALGATIAWSPVAAATVLDTTFLVPPEGQPFYLQTETTASATEEQPALSPAGWETMRSKVERGPTRCPVERALISVEAVAVKTSSYPRGACPTTMWWTVAPASTSSPTRTRETDWSTCGASSRAVRGSARP